MKRADVKKILELLGKHTSVRDALDEYGRTTGHTLSDSNLSRTFRAAGLGLPSAHLAPADAPYIEAPAKLTKDERKELQTTRRQIAWYAEQERLRVGTHNPVEWSSSGRSRSELGTPVLLSSDQHADEVVRPSEVNYVNAYNREIFVRRTHDLIERTENLLLNYFVKPSYPGIVVPMLGDMVSGNIHEELAETNEAPILDTLALLRDVWIGCIDRLLVNFKRVHLVCKTGNHGRLTRKPKYKRAVKENYEWGFYDSLRHHYQRKHAVTVTLEESHATYFNVEGFRFRASHGDEASGGGGVAGPGAVALSADARARKVAMATGERYDYAVMGHWHLYQHLAGDRVIVNGSTKGYDEYAMKNGFEFQVPTQALFLVHKAYGITFRFPVCLERPGTKWEVK